MYYYENDQGSHLFCNPEDGTLTRLARVPGGRKGHEEKYDGHCSAVNAVAVEANVARAIVAAIEVGTVGLDVTRIGKTLVNVMAGVIHVAEEVARVAEQVRTLLLFYYYYYFFLLL